KAVHSESLELRIGFQFFTGNDERLWESRPLGGGNIQRLSESLRFYIPVFTGMTKGGGNDERWRE
ncbi:hypothetical protein EWP20_05275, partial [Neisseria meningitidis]|nr:hypothetical protein [Neisseria meningitidis]